MHRCATDSEAWTAEESLEKPYCQEGVPRCYCGSKDAQTDEHNESQSVDHASADIGFFAEWCPDHRPETVYQKKSASKYITLFMKDTHRREHKVTSLAVIVAR